jgi:hypothetical protein
MQILRGCHARYAALLDCSRGLEDGERNTWLHVLQIPRSSATLEVAVKEPNLDAGCGPVGARIRDQALGPCRAEDLGIEAITANQ